MDRVILFEQGEKLNLNCNMNKAEIIRDDDGVTIRGNGNFSMPNIIKKYETSNEALAFIDGVLFVRNYLSTLR